MPAILNVTEQSVHNVPYRPDPRPKPNAARAPGGSHGSRFEAIARLSIQPFAYQPTLLGVLLAAARPDPDALQGLGHIWAEEAMHRSFTILRLASAQRQPEQRTTRSPAAAGIELGLAKDLAAQLGSLEVRYPASKMLPCSGLLQDVVVGIAALFAAPRSVTLGTDLEPLLLPQHRRRALVLAASELVMNALLHAFVGRANGRIAVTLAMISARDARLQVADDGIGFGDRPANLHCGVAAGLADLMQGDLVYYRTNNSTVAEIIFPVEGRNA